MYFVSLHSHLLCSVLRYSQRWNFGYICSNRQCVWTANLHIAQRFGSLIPLTFAFTLRMQALDYSVSSPDIYLNLTETQRNIGVVKCCGMSAEGYDWEVSRDSR